MIRAGTKTIEDKGFAITNKRVGGNVRQALVIELPAGITQTTLDAFCDGPIEVLGDDGEVTSVFAGPFVATGHTLTLMRPSEADDVSALTARIIDLEAELTHVKATRESALEELASAREELSTLMTTVDSPEEAEAEATPGGSARR